MGIDALLLQHGNKIFKVDAKDELGVFMLVDGYKIRIRQDDVSLASGMPLSEFYPLVVSLKKI